MDRNSNLRSYSSVYFIASAKEGEGTGHISRTLALYRYVGKIAREVNAEIKVLMIVDCDSLVNRLKWMFPEVVLCQNDEEIYEIIRRGSRHKKQLAVVDSLSFSLPKQLLSRVEVISISPKGICNKDADIVVARKIIDRSATGQNMEGLRYVLMGDEVLSLEKRTQSSEIVGTCRIGLFCGGEDLSKYGSYIAKQLVAEFDSSWKLHHIVGSRDVPLQAIERKVNQCSYVWSRTGLGMWSIFKDCDMLILRGGLAQLEATYLGIPHVCIDVGIDEGLRAQISEMIGDRYLNTINDISLLLNRLRQLRFDRQERDGLISRLGQSDLTMGLQEVSSLIIRYSSKR